MPPLAVEDVKDWGKSRVEKEIKERLDDVQSIRQKADGSLANLTGDADIEQVRRHNDDLSVLGDRRDAIRELETADEKALKMQRDLTTPANAMRHGGGEGTKSVDLRDGGMIFADSDGLKTYREQGIKGVEVEIPIGGILPEHRVLDLKGYKNPGMKAVLGEDSALEGVGTEYPVQSIRTGVMVQELFQMPNIADLIPQTTITQPAAPFMRETVGKTGAAETAEAAEAPEAEISFTEDSAPVRKIPVILPVTDEILEDQSLVRGHVNNRLPQFIRMREDSQLLNGTGAGQNLEGILKLEGIDATTSYSLEANPTAQEKLEAVFKALIKVQEAFLVPDASVMGLDIWEQLRLAKGTNGQYLLDPAAELGTARVWGLKVVTNQNMPAEAEAKTPILVGAFAQASQIWRRSSITLQVSDSHGTNFAKGILAIKATTRLAVTHYRAAGYAVVESKK